MNSNSTRKSTVLTEVCDFTQLIEDNHGSVDKNPAVLTLILGPEQWIGRVWPVTEMCSFGRDKKNVDFYIPERSMSRSHFQLELDGSKVKVKDLSSTNGTFVNKMKLKSAECYELKNNDLIKSGRLLFRFIESGHVEAYSALQLREQMYIDPLCQINNRKFIEDKMEEILQYCRKKEASLSFVLLDVDHFKKINDNHSHLVGDFILSCLASRVRKVIRREDILARIGGEEFLLITSASKDDSLDFAEKVRISISEEPFIYQGQKIQVSVSLGVTNLTEEDQHWTDLYKRADKALYQSKREGRNKVSIL